MASRHQRPGPLLAALLVALAGGLLAGCGPDAPAAGGSSPPQRVLRVGLEPEFEPMEYRRPDGEIVGFDVDLMNALAAELDVGIELVPIAWDGIIPALVSRKIDLICSGMTITPKRAESVAFTNPYFTTGLCLLINREKGADIEGWRDLDRDGMVVAVKRGTTGEKTAKELMPKAERKVYDSENDCALEVANGRVHAFVYDQLSILKHARKHERTTRALLEPFNEEHYGIAVRKEDTGLLEQLNSGLAALRANGNYQRIHEQYMSVAAEDRK